MNPFDLDFETLQSFNKINNYINSHDFKLIKKESNLIAYFGRKDQVIAFDLRKIKKENLISTLLHECGHLIHYVSMGTKADHFYDTLRESRKRIYNSDKFNKSDMLALLENEIVAWSNGLDLANKLEIPIYSNFFTQQEHCLNSYKSLFKTILN